MAYQKITRERLIERYNRVMRPAAPHFLVPSDEYTDIRTFEDMLHIVEMVHKGYDDEWRAGYDNFWAFYNEKAALERLINWMKNAPRDEDTYGDLFKDYFGVNK